MSANQNGTPPPLAEHVISGPWPITGEPATDTVGKQQHFDTFETRFFQQGDDGGLAADGFDEWEDKRRGRPRISRATLAAVATLSTGVAIAACLALGAATTPAPAPPVVAILHRAPASPPALPVAAAPTPTEPAAPIAQAAAPTPEPVAAPAPQEAVPPAPAAAAEPVAAPAPAPLAAAEPVAAPAPAPVAVAAPAPEPVAAPEPTPTPEPAAPTATAEAPARAAEAAAPSDARSRCEQARRARHSRDILAACTAAFAESADAVTAVALAKVELDRGHFAQANTWSRKAIALDPASADAYVFAGGAEQSQGHRKAAKEAYLQYLRLAPSGRYASEIRSVVNSL